MLRGPSASPDKAVPLRSPIQAEGVRLRRPAYQVHDLLCARYELVRKFGATADSAWWVVQDVVLDAQFAVKMLPNAGRDPTAAARMLNEARLAARIEHAAMTRVHDFGVTDRGDPFLVMDLLSGPSVRERLLLAGRLTPIDAVMLLLPIADALSVAHSRGVIHRGFRPESIVCVTDDAGHCQPKLTDLGSVSGAAAVPGSTEDGAPDECLAYSSPEQVQGAVGIDQRTDVWSFCVVLHEMVTGSPPFHRTGPGSRLRHAIVSESAPPISSFGIDDPELSSILLRGLQKAPADRWEDMHSLGAALARWLLRQGVQEDASAQALRTVWLDTSSSAPPIARDSRGGVERAMQAALAEDYRVPKRSALRPVLWMTGALLALVLIGFAGIHTVGSSAVAVPIETTRLAAAPDQGRPHAESETNALESPAFGSRLPNTLDAGPLVEGVTAARHQKMALASRPPVPALPAPKPMPGARPRAHLVTSPTGRPSLPAPAPISDNPYVLDGE